MEENKIFQLIEKMYVEMQNGFIQVNEKIDNLDTRMNSLETKVDNNTVLLEKAQDDINKGEEAYTYIQSIKDVFTNKG